MPKPRCRKFSLLDAMILVAGIAGGLAWFRYSDPDAGLVFFTSFGPLESPFVLDRARDIVERLYDNHALTTPIGACLTVAFLAIRLLQPRPDLRRLTRQPGFVATCIVSAILAGSLLHYALFVALHRVERMLDPSIPAPVAMPGATDDDTTFHFHDLGMSEGVAVGSCWFIALIGRRWRREKGWIDLAGVILGCYWIVGAALMTYAFSFGMLW